MADQPMEEGRSVSGKQRRRKSDQPKKSLKSSKKSSNQSLATQNSTTAVEEGVDAGAMEISETPSVVTSEAVIQVDSPPIVVPIPEGEGTKEPARKEPTKRRASRKSLISKENPVFIDIDDIEYNSDEEPNYEPPESDRNLPDLKYMIDTLNEDVEDLAATTAPPSLFTRPEHVDSYKQIADLRLQIEEEEIRRYVEEFEQRIKDDVLMIGSISLDEIQDEEKRLRNEHVLYQSQEAERARTIQEEIVVREELAKKHIAEMLKEHRKHLQNREVLAQQRERILRDRLHKAFRQSENRLVNILQRRKAEIQAMYGDLQVADGDYGGSKGRRWKVDWTKTPQPVQVKLKSLRGVKDKLPGGRYVIVTSLYDRLGGHVLKWSNLKGQKWGGSTLPTNHDGHFYNTEIRIDQSTFTVLPSKPAIRPSMVLMFELYLLRGAVVPTDHIVGWGCFPICDANFEVIEGKYKVPLLRGPMDYRIDKHEIVERLVSTDLDHWLCNFYFEIVRLPRYLGGQKEFEVELQFSSAMLNYPDRVKYAEDNRDGEDPVIGSGLTAIMEDDSPREKLTAGSSGGGSESSLDERRAPPPYDSHGEFVDRKPPISKSTVAVHRAADKIDAQSISDESVAWDRPTTGAVTTMFGSRAIQKRKMADSDSSDSEQDEEIYVLDKNKEEFKSIAGHPGLFYKRHLNTNPADTYHKQLYSLLPKTPLLTRKKPKRRLTRMEELELHTFSVQPPFSDKGHVKSAGREKLDYVTRMFLSELGLSQWRSAEFWTMIFLFVFVFFLRIFVHYILQWVLLMAIGIPVNKFEYVGYTVNLNYQSTLLKTKEEIAIVILGCLGNIIVFCLLICISYACQKILSSFPDLGSKFILVYGISTFLDAILIAVVDCALLRFQNLGGDQPIADCAKLWWHFVRTQGTGLGGVFITAFLYLFCMFFTASILYMYFLRLHNNGRMLDIFWRLHGEESAFFLPYDLEMSNYELSFLCRKAEQFRGEEGARRKVAIYDYIWEEDEMIDSVWDNESVTSSEQRNTKQETTTHVSIHTIHLDGLRELYRHFLRLPDGAIVEVFGEMAIPGLGKDITSALTEGAQMMEDLKKTEINTNKGRRPMTSWTTSGLEADGTFFISTGDIIGTTKPLPTTTTKSDNDSDYKKKEK
ncbi:uncharacterized protein LOC141909627 [Tubulanus polymorphus]|uniref:uncharacterized protein LOC141909627 n=1 Tax=Tubulanus polymorphus TaxID=672921 RepID=UPI003DA327A6